MAYTFGDYPELAFAIPFLNLSFQHWDGTLPEEWVEHSDPPDGAREKYNPGMTYPRALKISDVGTIANPDDLDNAIEQTIDMPAHLENAQVTRLNACIISELSGAGKANAVVKFSSVNPTPLEYAAISNTGNDDWSITQQNSAANIDATKTDLRLSCRVRSNGEADPAALFDCLSVEYGQSITERYYTLTRKPEFMGVQAYPFTFVSDDRTGIGKRRTWDPTGGVTKWHIEFPFADIPGAMVEALYDFYMRNKGLRDSEGVPLVLHHKLIDLSESFNLHMPPWIICDIVNTEFPFKFSGGYLGAQLWSGTLIFEEI